MRLSYTNPLTGERASRDAGVRFVHIDGVVLEVRHYYRSRGLWTVHAYRDHFHVDVALDWVKTGKDIVLVDVRRRNLLDRLARYTRTEEWTQKRAEWLELTKATRIGEAWTRNC